MKNIVLAIGNGGCNIADSIRKRCEKLGDAQYMFCDTDVEDLHRHGKAGDKFIALKSDETCLADVITADVNTVLVVATLGGETGSKFAPIAAAQTKKSGAKNVIAISTAPFAFEGENKRARAQKAAVELSDVCDKVILQDNEKLIADDPELNILTAFEYADKAIADSIETTALSFKNALNFQYP